MFSRFTEDGLAGGETQAAENENPRPLSFPRGAASEDSVGMFNFWLFYGGEPDGDHPLKILNWCVFLNVLRQPVNSNVASSVTILQISHFLLVAQQPFLHLRDGRGIFRSIPLHGGYLPFRRDNSAGHRR